MTVAARFDETLFGHALRRLCGLHFDEKDCCANAQRSSIGEDQDGKCSRIRHARGGRQAGKPVPRTFSTLGAENQHPAACKHETCANAQNLRRYACDVDYGVRRRRLVRVTIASPHPKGDGAPAASACRRPTSSGLGMAPMAPSTGPRGLPMDRDSIPPAARYIIADYALETATHHATCQKDRFGKVVLDLGHDPVRVPGRDMKDDELLGLKNIAHEDHTRGVFHHPVW